MSHSLPPVPAQHLRRARRAANLSQERLAVLAGVHVRTIRGLEVGAIARPRRRTLELIASALGLDVEREARLLEQWGHDVDSGHLRDTARHRSKPGTQVDEFIASAVAASRLLALSESIDMSVDRCPVRRRTEEVIVALRDNVAEHHVYFEADANHELRSVDIVETENCTVVGARIDTERRTKVFTLALPRRLRVADTAVLRYTINAAADASSPRPERGQEIGGFFHSPRSYVLEVRFASGAEPRTVAQVFQARPSGPLVEVRQAHLDHAATCHLAMAQPRPGGHGFAWSW